MSVTETNLCSYLLKHYFGESVQIIGKYLMKQPCKRSLLEIRSNVKLPKSQLKVGLRVLLMHGLAEVAENNHRIPEYGVISEKVLNLLHNPSYIEYVKEQFGDIAEVLISEIINHGKLTVNQAIKQTVDALQKLTGEEYDIQKISKVKDAFANLVREELICRVAEIKSGTYNPEQKVPITYVSEDKKFEIPEVKLHELTVTAFDEPPEKKLKVSGSGAVNDDIYFGINHEKFQRRFRDKLIVSSVSEFINEKAAEVVKTVFQLSEKITHPLSETTNNIGFHQIFSALKEKSVFTYDKELEPYLSILTNAEEQFMAKVDDRSGGLYVLNTHKILKRLAEEHATCVVRDRFGSKQSRIFRLILSKQYLEQKQIETLSMISHKLAKEHTYQMLKENFVVTQEISKTPDYAVSRTFFLFHVNITQVSRMLLERYYQAALNILVTYEFQIKEHKRVLEKKQRIEAIVSTLEMSGADAQQIEEVQQAITPQEQSALDKVENVCDMLFKSLNELTDMIVLIKLYLQSVSLK